MTWEHFHHQADIGIRGIGDLPEQAFEDDATALMAVICLPEKVNTKQTVEVKAAIFTELKVFQNKKNRWNAQCVINQSPKALKLQFDKNIALFFQGNT
jgi:SHS2 domain-containing protein